MTTLVLETGRPVRIDDYAAPRGAVAELVPRTRAYRSAVGVPITVEGRLWGLMSVMSDARGRRCRRTPRRGWPGSPNWSAPRSPTPRPAWSCATTPSEQAALRRVATLVAPGAPPEEVFAAVDRGDRAGAGGRFTGMNRYDADGTATIVGLWTRTDTAQSLGSRRPVEPRRAERDHAGAPDRPARADRRTTARSSGAFAEVAAATGASARRSGRADQRRRAGCGAS